MNGIKMISSIEQFIKLNNFNNVKDKINDILGDVYIRSFDTEWYNTKYHIIVMKYDNLFEIQIMPFNYKNNNDTIKIILPTKNKITIDSLEEFTDKIIKLNSIDCNNKIFNIVSSNENDNLSLKYVINIHATYKDHHILKNNCKINIVIDNNLFTIELETNNNDIKINLPILWNISELFNWYPSNIKNIPDIFKKWTIYKENNLHLITKDVIDAFKNEKRINMLNKFKSIMVDNTEINNGIQLFNDKINNNNICIINHNGMIRLFIKKNNNWFENRINRIKISNNNFIIESHSGLYKLSY
jgi:hypothetical protein